MSKQLNRLALCLALLLIAGTASASVHTFVMDGELLIANHDGVSVETLDLPVEPLAAYGVAGDRVLFTVEHVAPLPFSSIVGGETNLWAADRNGDAVQLTSGEFVMAALWSEVLGKVFYWTLEKNIYAMDLDGGARELLLDNAITPALSPDGREMAYVLTPEDWNADYHCMSFEIHVRDLFTGEDRVLVRGTDATELVWTPDGNTVIYRAASANGITSLWRIGARGGDSVQLTNVGLWSAKSPYFVMNYSKGTDVTWSNDGRSMLFGARYSEAGEVMVIQFDEQYDVARTLELTPGRNPFWGLDGEVRVPRRVLAEQLLKTGRRVHFAEFSIEPLYAEKVIDVAGAPREFLMPEHLKARLAEDEIPHKAIDKYRFPIHDSCGYPFTWYYDNNSGYQICRDWQCDWGCVKYNAYDGHKGTDIGLDSWWVYAGADGSDVGGNDGCDSYNSWGCGGGFGNYLKLYHGYAQGKYWYTIYAHMRNGSVVRGDKTCGTRLGITASSGNSTGSHLHFEVRAWGAYSDDPFSGACSGPVSYWCNQNANGTGKPSMYCC